jgi:hypothetical protein
MLLAFEGTGMQMWGGTSKKGLEDLSGTGSFVWRFSLLCNEDKNLVRYFPGPNVQGSNCDDIFEQAKTHYRELKKSNAIGGSTKINLVGYSRGAYIAMCFARFLEINDISVNFLGMFDPVSVDLSMEGIIADGSRWKEMRIPNNVKNCYIAARSPVTGSRKTTMNSIGKKYEDGRDVLREEFPGSHAAIGGFPNQAGVGDAPNSGQGDPNDIYKFDKRKELTAWWRAGDYISQAAFKHKLLKKSLVPQPAPKSLLPTAEWYKYVQPKAKAWETMPYKLY